MPYVYVVCPVRVTILVLAVDSNRFQTLGSYTLLLKPPILMRSCLQYIYYWTFLFIFFRSRNEVETLQVYKEKCAALETRLEALECNATKLHEYEQVRFYGV